MIAKIVHHREEVSIADLRAVMTEPMLQCTMRMNAHSMDSEVVEAWNRLSGVVAAGGVTEPAEQETK